MTLVACIILVASLLVLGYMTKSVITESLAESVLATQAQNLRIMSTAFKLSGIHLEMTVDENGHVKRTHMEEIPTFDNHDLIEAVGLMTQQKVTIFAWDDKTKDFWRKTTNIIKDDGQRAINTPLGTASPAYSAVTKGETFLGEAPILGKDYITIYQPVMNDENQIIGLFFAGIERQQAYAMSDKIDEAILIISALLIGIAATIMIFANRSMIQRLPRLIKVTDALAHGDLSGDIPHTQDADEMGLLARSLAVFKTNALDKIKLEEARKHEEIQHAKERKQMMLKVADDFNAKVGVIVSTVEHAAEQLQSMASSLAQAVTETTQQSATVTSASQQASANVQTVASATKELSASIREISRNIADTATTTRDCNQNAAASANMLSELRSAVDEIDAVIQAINTVAEQTNLLALNATIEAARAGDMGKGFAVVANEVKTLAGQTHHMTEDISQRVERIKSSTTQTVESIHKIIQQVGDIDQKTTSVASAVEQQNAATSEISRNVQQAAHGTHEVSHSIEEVQKAANDSAHSTESMRNAATDLAHQAHDLRSAVDDFLNQIKAA